MRAKPRTDGAPGRLRRHGYVRPTLPCAVLVAVDAVAAYAGLLLDERTLVAASICLVALLAVALVLTVVQWVLMRSGSSGRSRFGAMRVIPQFERVDQTGAVVERVSGSLPVSRGLYRHHSHAVQWVGAFGLFAAQRIIPWSGETLVLPDPAQAPEASGRVADRRMLGTNREERSGSVRAYTPGDPIKLISWRHTAHRGTLMTRESSGDGRSNILLVLNTRIAPNNDAGDAGGTGGARRIVKSGRGRGGAAAVDSSIRRRLDGAVAAMMAVTPALAGDGTVRAGSGAGSSDAVRVIATDGIRFHEGIHGAARFFASACAIPDAACADGARACTERASACAVSDAACAKAVSTYASRLTGPVRVILCDPSNTKGFEHALRNTPLGERMLVLEPATQVSYETAQAEAEIAQAAAPIVQADVSAVQASRNKSWSKARNKLRNKSRNKAQPRRETAQARPVRVLGARFARLTRGLLTPGPRTAARRADGPLPRAVAALALLVCFGLALRGLTGLVNPTGVWAWFAAAMLAIGAIGANMPYGRGASHAGSAGTAAEETGKDAPDHGEAAESSRVASDRAASGNSAIADRSAAIADRSAAAADRSAIADRSAASDRHTVPGRHTPARFRLPQSLHVPARIIRVCAYAAVVALTAGVLVSMRIGDVRDAATGAGAGTGTGTGMSPSAAETADSPWAVFIRVLAAGFDALNLQLPPITVDAAGDVFLVVTVAVVAIAVRVLLLWRGAMPLMAILPVVALAADYSVVGHVAPWWAIAALACAFPMSVWAYRPIRLAPPSAMLSSALVMALTLACTPMGEDLAYRVPLSIGEGGGMFTSNTVSPLIDLKRNIAAGSDSTVLRYRSHKRVYLRMTTLDQFDGDTWGYGKELALDAGLYGAGIQLGRSSENDIPAARRESMQPLDAYMSVLGYYGYEVAAVDDSTLERNMGYADIRIETLRSRFLPTPGIVYDTNGLSSDWLRYQDGSVYNRSGSTSSSTRYTANGTYLEPIRSSSGFGEVDAVVRTQREFEQQWTTTSEQIEGWLRERRALEASGLGEVHGDAVLVRATVDADGVVYGPNGWRLGKVSAYRTSFGGSSWNWDGGDGQGSGQGGGDRDGRGASADGNDSGDSDASGRVRRGTPRDITFDPTVRDQLGFGEDGIVYGSSADGGLGIVVPLTDTTTDRSVRWMNGDVDSYDGDYGTGDYGADREAPAWLSDAHDALAEAGFSRDVMTWVGGGSGVRAMLDYVRRAVERADQSGHASQYTALPDALPDNVRAVVRQAQAAGIPITGKSYDDQARAMRWLVEYFTDDDNHFTYSLDAPDGDGRSNLEVIDAFLDPKTGHAGYCQHYASALAVLGRAMGVPTRIVLGYNAGTDAQRDPDNGYYDVASRQLHAWVEAYLDGVGWVPFDVTPASEENGTLSSSSSDAASTDSSRQSDAASQTEEQDASTPSTETGNEVDASASDDADSDDSSAADDARNTAAASDDGSGRRSWGWLTDRVASMPSWVRWGVAVLAALALAAVAVATPRLRRVLRRRRCLALAKAAGGDADDAARARAWKAAWDELRREGRRAGARWTASDTDAVIAGRIDEIVSRDVGQRDAGQRDARSHDARSHDVGSVIRRVAREASACAFGGRPGPADGLADDLRRVFDATRR